MSSIGDRAGTGHWLTEAAGGLQPKMVSFEEVGPLAGRIISAPFARRERSGDWTQQDLAEFYRVENALIQGGLRIETERGVTDEGDPWFVFFRADSGDPVAHFARIDGDYVLASPAYDGLARGFDLRSLVQNLIARHRLLQTQIQELNSPAAFSKILFHPSALLVAVVGTAFFKAVHADAQESQRHSSVADKKYVPPVIADEATYGSDASHSHASDDDAAALTAAEKAFTLAAIGAAIAILERTSAPEGLSDTATQDFSSQVSIGAQATHMTSVEIPNLPPDGAPNGPDLDRPLHSALTMDHDQAYPVQDQDTQVQDQNTPSSSDSHDNAGIIPVETVPSEIGTSTVSHYAADLQEMPLTGMTFVGEESIVPSTHSSSAPPPIQTGSEFATSELSTQVVLNLVSELVNNPTQVSVVASPSEIPAGIESAISHGVSLSQNGDATDYLLQFEQQFVSTPLSASQSATAQLTAPAITPSPADVADTSAAGPADPGQTANSHGAATVAETASAPSQTASSSSPASIDEPASNSSPASIDEPASSSSPTSIGEPASSASPASIGEPASSSSPTSIGEPASSSSPASIGEPASSSSPANVGEPVSSPNPENLGSGTASPTGFASAPAGESPLAETAQSSELTFISGQATGTVSTQAVETVLEDFLQMPNVHVFVTAGLSSNSYVFAAADAGQDAAAITLNFSDGTSISLVGQAAALHPIQAMV
jgi:hypothetical protein